MASRFEQLWNLRSLPHDVSVGTVKRHLRLLSVWGSLKHFRLRLESSQTLFVACRQRKLEVSAFHSRPFSTRFTTNSSFDGLSRSIQPYSAVNGKGKESQEVCWSEASAESKRAQEVSNVFSWGIRSLSLETGSSVMHFCNLHPQTCILTHILNPF